MTVLPPLPMQDPTATTSLLESPDFWISTGFELLAVFVGVLLAQYFADQANRRDQAKADKSNGEFVRASVTTSLAHSLIAVWRHQHFVQTAGAPGSVGLINAARAIDPFRVTQALGSEAYEGLVTVTGIIDLTDRYIERLSLEHATAYFSERVRPDDAEAYARAFYADKLPQLRGLLHQAETVVRNLLTVIDPARLTALERDEKPRLQEPPEWMQTGR